MNGPPGNGEAALRHAATPKLTGLALDTPGHAFTQVRDRTCRHRFRRVEFMPAGHIHHAKETCDDCGAFLGSASKLENLERASFNLFKLSKLAMHPGRSDWERRFIKSLQVQKNLSPKQQAVLERLAAKCLEA